MRATDEGFPPSSPVLQPALLRERGVVVSDVNLGMPFDEVVVRSPVGVSTGVVAGPARSNVG